MSKICYFKQQRPGSTRGTGSAGLLRLGVEVLLDVHGEADSDGPSGQEHDRPPGARSDCAYDVHDCERRSSLDDRLPQFVLSLILLVHESLRGC